MLSDEQMSNGYPLSLLNDQQMSNKVGVERQPDMYEFLVPETDCSIQSRPQHSMFVSLGRKDCEIHSRKIMFQPLGCPRKIVNGL